MVAFFVFTLIAVALIIAWYCINVYCKQRERYRSGKHHQKK